MSKYDDDAMAELVCGFPMPNIDPKRFRQGWSPGFRAVIRPEGWAMIISKTVWGQKERTTPMRRFWCYVGAVLTLALLGTMAWLLANYHPERDHLLHPQDKVSDALVDTGIRKGAPARHEISGASGADYLPSAIEANAADPNELAKMTALIEDADRRWRERGKKK